MSALVLLLAAGAILLIAASLLLWQGAQTRAHQQAASVFVDRQLRSMAETANPETADAGTAQKNAAARHGQRAWRHYLRYFLLRAGIKPNLLFFFLLIAPGILLIGIAALFGGLLSAIGTAILYIALCHFRLWLKATRRHQRMVRQLPSFLDTMVRLATIGNSLESSFQSALLTTDAPLRDLLDRSNGLVQAGLDLEHALLQEARLFRLHELELIAAVIGVALRFGGRADNVLGRMASFMRDREQAQNELVALSAETRLSAWILGLLPIGLGLFMIIFNNAMFSIMLNDETGRKMLFGALALEVCGAIFLYRLAKSV